MVRGNWRGKIFQCIFPRFPEEHRRHRGRGYHPRWLPMSRLGTKLERLHSPPSPKIREARLQAKFRLSRETTLAADNHFPEPTYLWPKPQDRPDLYIYPTLQGKRPPTKAERVKNSI